MSRRDEHGRPLAAPTSLDLHGHALGTGDVFETAGPIGNGRVVRMVHVGRLAAELERLLAEGVDARLGPTDGEGAEVVNALTRRRRQ